MRTSRPNHALNIIRTALVGTALVAAANYVSPVEADMIYGAIGDDGSGPPGAFDGNITVSARSHEAGGGRLPEYAVDGTGIVLVGGDATDRDNYVNAAGFDDNGDFWNYLSANDGGIGWFKVDLGQTYTLQDAFFFNFNPGSPSGNESRGVSNAVIWYLDAASDPNANDDENGLAFDSADWTQLGSTMTFTIAPAGFATQTVADVINFGGVSARFVALDILSNHGHPNYVGLGEIQFFAGAGVPQPATLALLAFGCVALIRGLRRKH